MRIFAIPAAGKRVMHPAGSPKQGSAIPPEGMWINLDSYFRGRLRDGDITEAQAPAEPKKPGKETT